MIQYIPLTFISSLDDLKVQIKNTIIMKHVLQKYQDVRTLGELLDSTQYGYTASASENGTHKFLRITDIQGGKVDWNTVPYCDCEREEKYLVKRGDILIARTGGTTGKSFIINEEAPSNAVFASYLIKLRTNENTLLPEYLNLFLNSYLYWSQIAEMKSGSAQPNVNANKLKELQIPYCDIEIQKEIVKSLVIEKETVESFIEIISEVKKLLNEVDNLYRIKDVFVEQEELIKAYYNSLLTKAVKGELVQQDFNESLVDFLIDVESRKQHLIKEKIIKKAKPLSGITADEIPFQIPQNWKWVRLGDLVVKLGAGKTPLGGEKNYVDSGVKFIRSQNVWNEGLKTEDIAFISNETNESMAGSIVMPNDILLNITGASIGRSCLIPTDFDIGNVNQHVAIIRLINPDIRHFVHMCITSPMFQKEIMNVQVGVSREGLSMAKLAKFLIPLPPLEEQRRIIEKIRQKTDIIYQMEEQIKNAYNDWNLLFQKVLQEAFQLDL